MILTVKKQTKKEIKAEDMKNFDDLMTAVTFAEAGEQEKAREFMKGKKTVLLAISDKAFDRSALKYALNISKRVDANLEILYVSEPETERTRLQDFMSEVKEVGFKFSVVVKEGCMKKTILDYTDKRKEILFVIVGSTPELDTGCRTGEKAMPDVWKKLKCPLVVVSKNEAPAMA